MSDLSYGITLSVKSFHITGFESIDFRRRFGLDDSPSTYECKYAQSRTEVDEAFARAWFGNATWRSAEVEPNWLVTGELVPHEQNRDAVRIAPELPPERAKELYVRARLAEVERERDEAKADLNALSGDRDGFILATSEAIEGRNRALFDNEQLKAIVQRLEEQVTAHDDRCNDILAIANRNERLARDANDKFKMLYEEYKQECKRADNLAKLAEKKSKELDALKRSFPETNVPLQQQYEQLRKDYEQLRKDYENECIKADQSAARLNELADRYADLVRRIEATDSAKVAETTDQAD